MAKHSIRTDFSLQPYKVQNSIILILWKEPQRS